jgi:EAL domain-containing protein (putative c-di-GMP-specific phosphodiesterase class I)
MNSGHATLAANKILMILDEPFIINGKPITLKTSIGIALHPKHANNAEMLLQNTEIALDQAKLLHNDYHLYCKDSDAIEQGNLILEKELKDAIENDELVMYYQPQVSLKYQRVCGIEALVRWQHPIKGIVPPDGFIPLAESCGLIVPLTLWTLNTTLRHCSPCFKNRNDFNVSINLSAALLHKQDLVDLITQAMQIWDTKPSSLILEVTESAMMTNPDQSMKTLNRLHDAGIKISIDDFGTGHSSLAYLKQLPVNELKIDKSFVMNMGENQDDKKIVRSILDLGHNFELKVVAEGIENEKIMSELTEMGCDIGQGYHISRPVPLDELQEWMKNNH